MWMCCEGFQITAAATFYFGVGPFWREQSQSVWHYGRHPNG